MVFSLYNYIFRRLLYLLCNLDVIAGRLSQEAVISVIDCVGKTVIDWFDYPEAWYIHFLHGFGLYCLGLLPAFVSYHGVDSEAGSSKVLEYAFLFVNLADMLVGGLSLDNSSPVPVLEAAWINFRRRSLRFNSTFTAFSVFCLVIAVTGAMKF